jgi:hypothetical protein
MNAFTTANDAIKHAERSATGGTDIGVYAVQRFGRTYYDTEVFNSDRRYIHVATSTANEKKSGTPGHLLTG